MGILRKLLTAVLKMTALSFLITGFCLSLVQNSHAAPIIPTTTKNIVRSQLWHMGVNTLQDIEITEEIISKEEKKALPEELERAMTIFDLKQKGYRL